MKPEEMFAKKKKPAIVFGIREKLNVTWEGGRGGLQTTALFARRRHSRIHHIHFTYEKSRLPSSSLSFAIFSSRRGNSVLCGLNADDGRRLALLQLDHPLEVRVRLVQVGLEGVLGVVALAAVRAHVDGVGEGVLGVEVALDVARVGDGDAAQHAEVAAGLALGHLGQAILAVY